MRVTPNLKIRRHAHTVWQSFLWCRPCLIQTRWPCRRELLVSVVSAPCITMPGSAVAQPNVLALWTTVQKRYPVLAVAYWLGTNLLPRSGQRGGFLWHGAENVTQPLILNLWYAASLFCLSSACVCMAQHTAGSSRLRTLTVAVWRVDRSGRLKYLNIFNYI